MNNDLRFECHHDTTPNSSRPWKFRMWYWSSGGVSWSRNTEWVYRAEGTVPEWVLAQAAVVCLSEPLKGAADVYELSGIGTRRTDASGYVHIYWFNVPPVEVQQALGLYEKEKL